MFAKLLVAIVFAAAVGAVLLGLRQQRLEAMHEMAQLHRQMDVTRQATWDLQVRIAEQVDPTSLLQAIEQAGLDLESAGPGAAPGPTEQPAAPPHPRVAESVRR